jgi:hypothetical protein
MKHLILNEDDGDIDIWCDEPRFKKTECVANIEECECVECLRQMGSVGAAAAMRCVALEQGSDARETSQERDHAIAQLRKYQKALAARNLFICDNCIRLQPLSEAAIQVGTISWCKGCQEAKEA